MGGQNCSNREHECIHRPNVVKTCFTCRRYTVKSHAWENQQHACYYGGTPMRHRKTACFEALVLEPHFAQSCGRFLLLTWGKVLAAAGSESFMVEKSIAGSGARAEPLQAAAQSVATGISTVLLWLADAICHCFLMLALLRPSRRTRKNRSRQQSAASGCF